MSKRLKKDSDKVWFEKKKIEDAKVDSALGDEEKFKKTLEKYPVKIRVDPLSNKIVRKHIPTGTILDELLSVEGKGLEEGATYEVYGEFATGKSRIIETVLAEAEGQILMIDTEGTWRDERFEKLCEARGKDPKEVSSRLMVVECESYRDQEAILVKLKNEYEFDDEGNFLPVGLIAVDSLMTQYRDEPKLQGRQNLWLRQPMVRAWLNEMRNYAKRHGAILIYSNQIYDRMNTFGFQSAETKIGASGGRSIEHKGDYRILLLKGYGNTRIARLIDNVSGVSLREVMFRLTEKGVEDLPPEELEKSKDKTGKYDDKQVSGQVGREKAGEKWLKKAEKNKQGKTMEDGEKDSKIHNDEETTEQVQDIGKEET